MIDRQRNKQRKRKREKERDREREREITVIRINYKPLSSQLTKLAMHLPLW